MRGKLEHTLGNSATDSPGNPLFRSRRKNPLAARDHQ
jgi:hypothetical protein